MTLSRTVTVPASVGAGIQTFQLPEFFTVVDDNINENDQIFAVIVEIGADVPEGTGCFLLQPGAIQCVGKGGATRVIIRDNDRELNFIHCLLVLPAFSP